MSRLQSLRTRLGDQVFFHRVIFISGRGYTRSGTLISVDGSTCVIEWMCDSEPIRESISTFLITSDEAKSRVVEGAVV